MKKEDYIRIVKEKLKNDVSKEIMIKQINIYYEAKENFNKSNHPYKIGDDVKLNKGTLLHGTYKNIEGLKEIVKNGLISSWFIDGRISKYPSSVGLWNLKKDYMLKDYINLYSGGTIMYCGIFENGLNTQKNQTEIVPYDNMNSLLNIVTKVNCHMWTLEQTKEARFMPSLVQNEVQIGIIFNGKSVYAKKIKEGDTPPSFPFKKESRQSAKIIAIKK